MSDRALRRAVLAVLTIAAAVLAPEAARAQQGLPPLEVLLENAKTREDSVAIRQAYEAAAQLQNLRLPEAEKAERPRELGPEGAPDTLHGAPPRAGPEAPTAANAPEADPTYKTLVGQPDTTLAGTGRGPILYSGNRLVFYPQSEVIVLEGAAQAEQTGTELKAQRILYRSREGVVEAFEQASVARGDSKLGADSLFYDRDTGAVATFGASVLSEGQSETKGVDLRYDLERKSGRLGGGTTTYAPWILEGADMEKVGATTYLVRNGYFTTCDLEEPHYTFRSNEIKMRKDDVIVAKPVVLYFSDIPVFWLPWYVEPVTRGRASGFLRPKIGLNTLIFGTGQERNIQDIGYYYVFNDYADAKVSADWYTESRLIVRGDFRYNKRHEFSGAAHLEQVWNRLDHTSSRLIRYNHDQTIGTDTRFNVDVNWSNSRSYLQRNSFDPQEILQRSFRSAASYSTRFDWGSLVAGANADFQLQSNRTDFRLPDLRLSVNQRPLWGAARGDVSERPWYTRLQYSANASFVSRLSRAQVDSAGNPLSTLPTDSLGNTLPTDRATVVNQQEGRTQFTLNGPLDLLGVIKTTPSLSYAITANNDQLADSGKFGGQGQMSAGLSMSTRFFRVFHSVPGPFTAMRHVVSPGVNFSYSPKPTFFGSASDAANRGFSRESFTANFSLGQDFEVKIPVAGGGGGEADSAKEADGEGPRKGEPQTRTVTLLSITNSMPFDFLRQKQKGKLGFGNLSTRVTSGLGRDFNISMTMDHELVKRGGVDTDDRFSPFLQRITTDFSMHHGGGVSFARRDLLEQQVTAGRGADEETSRARENLEAGQAPGGGGFGPWSLSLTHQWSRTRDGQGNRQSVGIGAQLLPSPSWSLNYQTTYDITNGKLQGQTLSLVRDLHDWQATLGVNYFPAQPQDRVLISFSVFLRDVPDFEIPYRVRRE